MYTCYYKKNNDILGKNLEGTVIKVPGAGECIVTDATGKTHRVKCGGASMGDSTGVTGENEPIFSKRKGGGEFILNGDQGYPFNARWYDCLYTEIPKDDHGNCEKRLACLKSKGNANCFDAFSDCDQPNEMLCNESRNVGNGRACQWIKKDPNHVCQKRPNCAPFLSSKDCWDISSDKTCQFYSKERCEGATNATGNHACEWVKKENGQCENRGKCILGGDANCWDLSVGGQCYTKHSKSSCYSVRNLGNASACEWKSK